LSSNPSNFKSRCWTISRDPTAGFSIF
jgi:hypothetical protein